MAKDEIIICTMRADIALEVTAGSSFEFTCARCNSRVVLSPSTIELKAAKPEAVVVCFQCLKPDERPSRFAANDQQLLNEVRNRIPNPWRNRN